MKCSLCHHNKTRHFLDPYRGRNIYLCTNCTNAFTYPLPKRDYKNNQFFSRSLEDKQIYCLYAKAILDFIKIDKESGKFLDVGTGAGYLIEEAVKRGYQAEGIEVSKPAVEFCRKKNLKVRNSVLKESSFPDNSFDIVVASHCLEHVENPIEFLSVCKKILKPGGYLCLAQTNYTGTIPRLLGKFWEGWVSSEHFVHFSPKGISFILGEKGFLPVKIKILPLGYQLLWHWGNLSIIANNLYNSINYLISKFKLGFPFVGDQMYILAQKKS